MLSSKAASFLTGSPSRVFATTLVVAGLVGGAKFAIVGILVNLQTRGVYLRLQDSVVTGLLAALAVWAALIVLAERRKFVRTQVEAIANLNHELRNALEVILGSEYLRESTKGAAILDSVERINRALDNILGTGPKKKDQR